MKTNMIYVLIVFAWTGGLALLSSFMRRKEAENYYQLQVSKASHPAGKALNRQIRLN